MTEQRVYVVLWKDRHIDTEAYVFSDADMAISWARRTARENNRTGVELDEDLTPPMESAGWLYYGCYSTEGDHVRVVQCVVDAEQPTKGNIRDDY